ncbi:MAG: PD-(D/E)XK nuclease family protein [Vicinamibacterales bacterium]
MAIIVPSSSAAATLRETIETRCLAERQAVLIPDILTRDELYERLHAQLRDAPARLSQFEREVIFRRCALDAATQGTPVPFALRAGLVGEILSFYDQLRRRSRSVAAFERLLTGSLAASADTDRGAERLLRLTRFLAAAFNRFEQRIAATGRVDEHGLRALLLEGAAADTAALYRHVIVTVPDQAADRHGLWSCDYDLLARLPHVERLEIVATENLLATGYYQRIHDAFPEMEEESFGRPASLPVLAVPEPQSAADSPRWNVCRDREEELVAVVRSLKSRTAGGRLDRTAIVFQRPLPYLYLAREVFADGEVPYQAFDALPLAAEPFAGALDLLFSFVISDATRGSLVELLASHHWSFEIDGRAIAHADVAALDERLKDLKYSGGWDALQSLARDASFAAAHVSRRQRTKTARLGDALRAAAEAAVELRDLRDGASASVQVSSLLAFITAHERLPDGPTPAHDAHGRARAAVLGILTSLRDAHRMHDDTPLTPGDLLTTIRRWIEGQTFSPRTGSAGVLLIDAAAAAYAEIDDLRLVGLVDSDWPEKSGRSIFYPAQLLGQLGWPPDADRLSAARARFHDLLRLPRIRTTVSTFTLEEDAIVPASVFVEEIDRAGLPVEHLPLGDEERVFVHEAIAEDPVVASAAEGEPREWLSLRLSRTSGTAGAYHGAAGAREAIAYSVSSLERYLECPFKYFAAQVLRLPEERADESGLTPQERGRFVHAVFEEFFREWQASGHGSVTTANLGDAAALFETIAERQLEQLPESDRALERTHLLGSAAAAGLAERAFAFEIEQGGEVIERLLEHELQGEFEFRGASGVRSVRLRAKADRIDLMSDGTIRIVDYKLSKAPKPSRSLQLPVYGICAQQALDGRHQRSWTLGRAGYVAFREKNAFVSLGGSSSLDEALAAGQERLLGAVDGIERGDFPPNPEEPFLCSRCAYSSVCRKDYVGDD